MTTEMTTMLFRIVEIVWINLLLIAMVRSDQAEHADIVKQAGQHGLFGQPVAKRQPCAL